MGFGLFTMFNTRKGATHAETFREWFELAQVTEEVGIRSTVSPLTEASFRPTRANRTAKGVRAYDPGLSVEPIREYGTLYGTDSNSSFGFEHPWWQEKLAGGAHHLAPGP